MPDDTAIPALASLVGQRLAYLEDVAYFCAKGDAHAYLCLTGLFQSSVPRPARWPDPSRPFVRVVLRFDQVSNVAIKDLGGRMRAMTGFEILDVRTRGWETVRYLVEDSEHGSLSFGCRDVAIVEQASVELPHLTESR